jgi:hypothetical protein
MRVGGTVVTWSHRIGELRVRRIVESGGRHETGSRSRRGRNNEQLW